MHIFFNFVSNSVLFHISNLLKFFFCNKQRFHLTEMGNKSNRRPGQAQSPSLERNLSTSEIETSQRNETTIETQ